MCWITYNIIFNVESSTNLNKQLKLGKAKFGMDSFKININTYNHDYVLGMAVRIEDVAFLKDPDASYGFEIAIISWSL